MGLAIVIAVAAIIMAGLWRFGHLSSAALTLTGAALALGMAGYAWQGQPGLPGSPFVAPPTAEPAAQDASMRDALMGRFGANGDRLAQADSFFNIGRPDLAIRVIQLGLKQNSKDAQLWIGLGTALVQYGHDQLSPAAEFSFKRAIALAPDYSGSYYFYGLELARVGRVDDARDVWLEMLRRSPKDSPQRANVVAQLISTGVITAEDAQKASTAKP
jgi:cytochrome c-type biogenesis protein CcmH